MKKVGGEITAKSDAELLDGSSLHTIALNLMQLQEGDWNEHSLVCMKRQTLSKVLYINNLYQQIIHVPGVICEFGVHWGSTLATLINLRGIYEPFNHSRRIYGFDTFEGFCAVNPEDGSLPATGDYATSENYEQTLEKICSLHEANAPISHIRKFGLIKGDASETVDEWLNDNQHAVIAMAIFDMDLYKPTKDVLQKIIPRLTKGSLLVFDELNDPSFPGETLAMQEVLGSRNLSLRQFPHHGFAAWAVYGD
jgi:hypothetical protein